MPSVGTSPGWSGAPGAVRVSPGTAQSEGEPRQVGPRGSAVSARGCLALSPAAAARPPREQLRLSWVTANRVTPQAAARREGESRVILLLHAGLKAGSFPSETRNESRKGGCVCQDLRSRIQARLQL